MAYSLGIDFGTSSTKIALQVNNGIPHPLILGTNGTYIPSVVAFEKTKNGKVRIKAVGDVAESMEDDDNTRVIKDIKRFLFLNKSQNIEKLKKKYTWWNDKENCVTLWNTNIGIEEIAFSIITKAIEEAVVYLRGLGLANDIDNISIRGLPTNMACPVLTELNMRRHLLKVARCAGYSHLMIKNILEEPILAAISYVKQHEFKSNDILLVYDFGGGTFDTAIVKVDKDEANGNPKLTIFAVDGEPFCGGSDIDQAFCDYIKNEFTKKEKFSEEEIAVLDKNEDKIQKECRKAKEFLSSHEEYPFDLLIDDKKSLRLKTTITRKVFERILKDSNLVSTSLSCVIRAWRRARMVLRKQGETIGTIQSVMKLDWKDLESMITKVLMVGGTTQIPFVKSSLKSFVKKAEYISADVFQPIEACSIGASYQWDLIESSVNRIIDRLQFSVCIDTQGTLIPLYEAYQPIVEYIHTNWLDPKIEEYKTPTPVNCSDTSTVQLIDGDNIRLDIEMPFEDLRSIGQGPYYAKIDRFGYIVIHGKNGKKEIPNPDQDPLQRAARDQIEQNKAFEEQKHRNWLHDIFHRHPGEDHNTDVG